MDRSIHKTEVLFVIQDLQVAIKRSKRELQCKHFRVDYLTWKSNKVRIEKVHGS